MDSSTPTNTTLDARVSSKSKKHVDIEKIKTSLDFKNLSRFFSQEKNFELCETVLKKKKKISLRIIEYVTANSRKFFFNMENHGRFRDILDRLGKKRFDVFRRHSRFEISLRGRKIITNLAQLRFFEFAIRSGSIQWLLDSEANVKQAEKFMNAEIAKKLSRRGQNQRKKRKRELKAIGASNVVFRF